jgi:tRNA pseudouridine32 synthase / 23S rRNA pseudouridine746 synthase
MDMLYSDSALLIVNKPAGIPVLPDGWDLDAPYLVQQLKQLFSPLFVVHRLDKVTSGVMVFARTAEAHRALSIQFERHTAQKVYHAICVGLPQWDEHTARHKLRTNVGHSHRTVVDNGHGKPTETHFKLIKRYPGSTASAEGYGLLECTLMTGRMHQIRVHASALGYPLLADKLYGAPPTDLIARPALHALKLMLTHPETGQRLTFEAPYPEDFSQAIAGLEHLA